MTFFDTDSTSQSSPTFPSTQSQKPPSPFKSGSRAMLHRDPELMRHTRVQGTARQSYKDLDGSRIEEEERVEASDLDDSDEDGHYDPKKDEDAGDTSDEEQQRQLNQNRAESEMRVRESALRQLFPEGAGKLYILFKFLCDTFLIYTHIFTNFFVTRLTYISFSVLLGTSGARPSSKKPAEKKKKVAKTVQFTLPDTPAVLTHEELPQDRRFGEYFLLIFNSVLVVSDEFHGLTSMFTSADNFEAFAEFINSRPQMEKKPNETESLLTGYKMKQVNKSK